MKPLILATALLMLLLSACTSTPQQVQSSAPLPEQTQPDAAVRTQTTTDPVPTASPWQPPTRQPSPPPPPADSGWYTLTGGLEGRVINLTNEYGSTIEVIHILRLDPSFFRFDVDYEPFTPRDLSGWQAHTGALIVVNGGYFSKDEERYSANGLIIVDGEPFGVSYGPFGGMLAINSQGPQLRWLSQQPYDPSEPLEAGLQSFPLLVKPGGELGFLAEHEDNRMARRTVIGQDDQGHILLLVSSIGHFTLHHLSKFLVESDLDLDIAMNLDGGPSSGMLVALPSTEHSTNPFEEIPANSVLPVVITIYPKSAQSP